MSSTKKKVSVIISGMPSVGKTTAAATIAEKFGLRHLAGGDMLKRLAEERGYKVSGSDWWDTKDGIKFLSERKTNPEMDKEVDRLLLQEVRRGEVVVTSYPLPWLSKSGFKLWFKGSQKTRAKRLAGRDSISFSKALLIVRKRDLENWRLYQRLYKINFGKDLSVFNYEIDTEKLDAEQVASMSERLVEEYAGEKK